MNNFSSRSDGLSEFKEIYYVIGHTFDLVDFEDVKKWKTNHIQICGLLKICVI